MMNERVNVQLDGSRDVMTMRDPCPHCSNPNGMALILKGGPDRDAPPLSSSALPAARPPKRSSDHPNSNELGATSEPADSLSGS